MGVYALVCVCAFLVAIEILVFYVEISAYSIWLSEKEMEILMGGNFIRVHACILYLLQTFSEMLYQLKSLDYVSYVGILLEIPGVIVWIFMTTLNIIRPRKMLNDI